MGVYDALGHEYAYEYDPSGNVTRIIMPDGDTITAAYNARNELTSSADEAGVITSYEYDPMGRITKASDNTGNVMLYEYGCDNIGLNQKTLI